MATRFRENGFVLSAISPDDWERFAPITLAREEPVAQLVIDGAPAEPCSSSQAMIFFFASGVGRPSISGELIAMPSSSEADRFAQGSCPAAGRQRRIGRSNLRANSKSRSSCAGTAMIAPVP